MGFRRGVIEGLQKEPFEPLKKSPRKFCTFKTVLLVALATARKSSEIAALGRVEPYHRYEAGGVRLRTVPDVLSKMSTPFHLGQDMFLADLKKENKKLCVRRAVRHYIRATTSVLLRDESHLFISVKGPNKGRAVSSQTIAR